MGCTDDECYYDWEKPSHKVTLTNNYYIGETEVTQELWYAVMGKKPVDGYQWDYYGVGNDYPAYYVSWNDIQEFITKLNEKSGKVFRLPTEAEWEYAARGGKKSNSYKYSGSNTLGDVAWFWETIPSQDWGTAGCSSQPVKKKQSNELGIYDMSGNVWEWCSDWYSDYSSNDVTNPAGPSSGSDRVIRGGSWFIGAVYARVSNRNNNTPDNRNNNIGFRLACNSKRQDRF
jgi:formylglycine-generating enzyme required for sulfatase activity